MSPPFLMSELLERSGLSVHLCSREVTRLGASLSCFWVVHVVLAMMSPVQVVPAVVGLQHALHAKVDKCSLQFQCANRSSKRLETHTYIYIYVHIYMCINIYAYISTQISLCMEIRPLIRIAVQLVTYCVSCQVTTPNRNQAAQAPCTVGAAITTKSMALSSQYSCRVIYFKYTKMRLVIN